MGREALIGADRGLCISDAFAAPPAESSQRWRLQPSVRKRSGTAADRGDGPVGWRPADATGGLRGSSRRRSAPGFSREQRTGRGHLLRRRHRRPGAASPHRSAVRPACRLPWRASAGSGRCRTAQLRGRPGRPGRETRTLGERGGCRPGGRLTGMARIRSVSASVAGPSLCPAVLCPAVMAAEPVSSQ